MRNAAAFAVCGTIVLLGSCNDVQSALHAAGPAAIALKQLILMVVIFCTAVWLVIVAVLVLALVRFRREDSNANSERRLCNVVSAAMGATVLAVAGLTVASFYTTRHIGEASEGALTIQVRGLQWWWQFIYLNASGEPSFQTANELHIPVGRDIRLQLRSGDVIHSFWVPSLAGKQDLIPGRDNTLTVRAQRPGIYRGQCAEFCGLQHSHMALLVIADEEADYDRWVDAQQHDRNPPTAVDSAAGEAVFMSKSSAACHTIRGTSATGNTGPDLTHVGSRQTLAAGLLQNTRGSIAAWIADPQTLKPGNNMPLVTLSSDELQKVSAYLESLR